MSEFVQLWDGGPCFAQAEHFKLGTDSVLLADFVRLSGVKRGIDLGCASGIIALLLLCRSKTLHMCGLEIDPAAAALARENMEKNVLSDRSEIICGDIRDHRALFKAGSFDLVAANPPYFAADSGFLSPDTARAAARGELQCTLHDLCAAAAFLLKTGGTLSLVFRCERFPELLRTMEELGIEPKRLRFVQNSASSAPKLFLIEGRKGGNPGLKIEAPLLLTGSSGNESEEYKRIYHR